MTKYYMKFDTMKHIIQAPENCSLEDMLYVICQAEEIACRHAFKLCYFFIRNMDNAGHFIQNEGIQLRRNEKKFLNDLNIDKGCRLRFHILDDKGKRRKRIQTREQKIFILINDCLTGDPLVLDLSMNQVSLHLQISVVHAGFEVFFAYPHSDCCRT